MCNVPEFAFIKYYKMYVYVNRPMLIKLRLLLSRDEVDENPEADSAMY